MWSTLSRYKIPDFVLLTSPYPLPLCLYLFLRPSLPPPPPPLLLIAAAWKKLQEKELSQRKKEQYVLLIYCVSGL